MMVQVVMYSLETCHTEVIHSYDTDVTSAEVQSFIDDQARQDHCALHVYYRNEVSDE